MELSQDEFESIRKGEFVLDCPRARLVQAGSGDRVIASGSAVFSITDDRSIRVKALFPDVPAAEAAMPLRSYVRGKLLSSDHYREILATDWKGRAWRATRLDPSWSFGEGAAFEASAQEISTAESPGANQPVTSGSLLWLGDPRLPMSKQTETTTRTGTADARSVVRNREELQTPNLEISIESHTGHLLTRVRSRAGALPTQWHTRIAEAMRFATGHAAEWTIVVATAGDHSATRIRAVNVRPRRSAALPPLNASDPEHWRDYWRIFASYLEMALATEGDLLHPLSPLVSMVVDSQSSTLEVQRLVLGVVVEAVLNVAYVRWPSVAMPPSDEVEVLRLLIKDAAAQPALKRRVSTFIDGVRSPRAKDRLREIMAAGLIYERHLRAWDRVRNTSAHGAWSREILSQESIDELWTALNLFHRLVLNATGYSGRHTDYSQSGFPVADVRCVGPFWDRSELNDATGQRLIDE